MVPENIHNNPKDSKKPKLNLEFPVEQGGGWERGSVAALITCYCLVIVAAVIILGLAALFLLFVLLSSQGLQAIHVRPYES